VAGRQGGGEAGIRDVRKYAAEQGIAEDEALKKGMEEESKEFVENGAEVYAKT
jgi:phosphomethylpyrimidine synthase